MANSVDPDQTAPFQSNLGPPGLLLYLNWSVILGNYLQQRTSAEVIFQMHFFLGDLRVKGKKYFFFQIKLAMTPHKSWGPRLAVNRVDRYNDNLGYVPDGDEEKKIFHVDAQIKYPYNDKL